MVSRFFLQRYTLFWALAIVAIAFLTLCFDVGVFASVERLQQATHTPERALPRHTWRVIDETVGFDAVYQKAFREVCPSGNAVYRLGSSARLYLRFSRREVYTWYLNQLTYKDMKGIRAISQGVFRKEPAHLSIEELKEILSKARF